MKSIDKFGDFGLGFLTTKVKVKDASRHLVLRVAKGAPLRTASLHGRDHVVVPVIALVQGVIQASNSQTPELVLASEFSKDVQLWNGRPVMFDHPTRNGGAVSANSPDVLEGQQLGFAFNARVEDDSLKMEVWLDPEMVKAASTQDVVDRLRAGDTVDVSVGVVCQTEMVSGSYKGASYTGVWRGVRPDHLAMLPAGVEGACSIEMGCGASKNASGNEDQPRDDNGQFASTDGGGAGGGGDKTPSPASTASPEYMKDYERHKDLPAHSVVSKSKAGTVETVHVTGSVSGKKELQYFGRAKNGEGLGTFKNIPNAQRAVQNHAITKGNEQGFSSGYQAQDIPWKDVTPKKKSASQAGGEKMKVRSLAARFVELIQKVRTAAGMDGEGVNELREKLGHALFTSVPAFLSIVDIFPEASSVVYCAYGDDGESYFRASYTTEGDAVTIGDAEPVEMSIEYKPVTAASAPSCGCGGETHNKHAAGKDDMKTKLIAKILARKGFTAEDAAYLLTLSEARLQALAAAEEEVPVVETPATPPPVVEEPKKEEPLTEDKALSMFPRLARIVAGAEQVRNARKAELLLQLKDAAGFTADELKLKEVEELEKLAVLAGKKAPAIDYSGAGSPAPQPSTEPKVAKAPSTREAILAHRGIKTSA